MLENILAVSFILLFNVVLYFRTLNYGLVMDDFQWWRIRGQAGFFKLSKIRSLGNFKAVVSERLYGGTTFGLNIKMEHAFTLFLHALTCVLMFFVFGRNEVSFWAATLYACNPINNQTSCWLNGRRYSLNTVFLLVMMLVPVSSIALYPFSLLLQTTAFFSPVLLAASSPWYLLLMPIVSVIGWKELKEKCDTRSGVMPEGDLKTFKWTRLIVITKTFGFFFWKMIFPQACAMQYPDRIKWGQTEEGNRDAYSFNSSFIAGIWAFMSCIVLVLLLPSAYRQMAIFMTLAILQWSAILPITQILSDRYCSLPNVFMMFFVAYLAHFAGAFFIPIMIILIAYYIICLSSVMPMYKDLSAWYNYHLQRFPGLSWYRHNLISDLMNEGNKEEAFRVLVDGLYYDRTDFRLLMWGAVLSAVRGEVNTAEDFLDEATKNFYINKEEDQTKEIESLRSQIKMLKPLYKKTERLTGKEKALLLRRRGVRP